VDEIMTAAGPARVELERPERPAFLIVLTHGSGGTPDTADVLAVRDAAVELGAATALVTQPYVVRGGRAPGSAAKQDAAWAELVEALRRETARGGDPLPLVQCGRSNGARVVCRTAPQVGAAGVIALAFPLHPPGQPDKSRAAELRSAARDGAARDGAARDGAARDGAAKDSCATGGAGKGAGARVLVVNGERDPFGVPEADGATEVVVLPGEAHALSKHPAGVGAVAATWLRALFGGSEGGSPGR